MSMVMTVGRTSSIGGKSLAESQTLSGDAAIIEEVEVPAAIDCTLTTRTDDNTGVVTFDDSGFAIEENDLVDVYWTGGCRRSMVAGVPSGATVSLDGGSGDVLPTQDTELTVAVAQELDLGFLGTNLVALAMYSQSRGQLSFQDAGGEEYAVELGAGESKTWHNLMASEDNPVTGDQITKVLVSHAATAARTMRVAVLYDND